MDLPTEQREAPLVCIHRDLIARIDALDSVHELIAEYWNAANACGCCQVDATWRALFDSAVAEIAGNIVRHAYADAPVDETYSLSLHCFPNRVEAILIDHGLPFDFTPPTRTPDMRDALDNFDLDHGWGLPIIMAATDSLNYERLSDGHNRWQLDKRLP